MGLKTETIKSITLTVKCTTSAAAEIFVYVNGMFSEDTLYLPLIVDSA